jgi:FAD/FMN-containing dehydrogenase/Fe-S oxidoreductase
VRIDPHAMRKPGGVDEIDTEALERSLRASVRGEVHFDAGNRAAYSHDSSNYRQAPIGVVLPRDADDIEAAVAAAREHGAPVTPRGCGTSLAGAACNAAVVIDTSKHMREIVEIQPEERFARVQPGVIRDDLARITEERWDLTFGPDTSTHEYATFGGMVGANSCGVHSVMAGRTADNVIELEVLTYDGQRQRVGRTGDDELERLIGAGGRRGEIYRRMRELRDRYAEEIRDRYPDIPRRVSGYNLDELLPEKGFDVARALTGSEGTLATVLEAKVRLVDAPPIRSLVVLGFKDIFAAADYVPDVLEHEPTGLEGMDEELVNDMRREGQHVEDLELLPEGKGWLLAEFGGETREEADDRAEKMMRALGKGSGAPAMKLYDRQAVEMKLWKLRESGLGATAFVPGEPDAWEGWEDAAVPPEREGEYLRAFQKLLDEYGYHTTKYGHFGDGCIHCRINFDLRTAQGLGKWRSFLDEAADLVVEHGGSLSGEHGDGQSRGELLEKMYGPDLVKAFQQMKAIWDPEGRMNPGKVVDPYPILSNLKLGTGYDPPEPQTHFAYPEDRGSFAHATMRCVGAGLCRDTESGTMCPSYMVTRDEQHTTRGRARILYEMLQGDVISDGFRSDEVHEALDLCLACKGCKGDCPVNVDMATYKAEFLSKHYKRRLRPLAAYSMGLVMFWARIASRVPRLANAITRIPLLGRFLMRAAGLSPHREAPAFARQTFRSWFRERGTANPNGPPVLLFPDTFNEHFHPDTAKSATRVLEAAGFRVVVPDGFICCGRPLYDYGMLDTAKLLLKRLVERLTPYARAGVPIVGLEPSCVAALRDELPAMLIHDEDATRIAECSMTLAEFLEEHAAEWTMPRLGRRAIVHGHCHQEAVMGMDADEKLLERLGLDYELLDSGCCGLAGSFGFEADKYEISVAIGERRLLPAVREAPAESLIVADGFSCRTQIEQLTDRRAIHIAEAIELALTAQDLPPAEAVSGAARVRASAASM